MTREKVAEPPGGGDATEPETPPAETRTPESRTGDIGEIEDRAYDPDDMTVSYRGDRGFRGFGRGLSRRP